MSDRFVRLCFHLANSFVHLCLYLYFYISLKKGDIGGGLKQWMIYVFYCQWILRRGCITDTGYASRWWKTTLLLICYCLCQHNGRNDFSGEHLNISCLHSKHGIGSKVKKQQRDWMKRSRIYFCFAVKLTYGLENILVKFDKYMANAGTSYLF